MQQEQEHCIICGHRRELDIPRSRHGLACEATDCETIFDDSKGHIKNNCDCPWCPWRKDPAAPPICKINAWELQPGDTIIRRALGQGYRCFIKNKIEKMWKPGGEESKYVGIIVEGSYDPWIIEANTLVLAQLV